jgi:chemotaxis protein CheD
MGQYVVGIGEYKVTAEKDAVIKTFALGSCVAVIVYDKVRNIGGIIHIALPDSNVDKGKSENTPGYFADTGIPVFMEELKSIGAGRGNIWIKLAGDAKVMDPNSIFDIGKRNALAIKKELWKLNLGPQAEDLGGEFGRTVSLNISTGEVIVSSGPDKWNL